MHNLENTGGATKLGKYWWSNKTQKILVEQQNLENTGGATNLENTGRATKLGKYWWSNKTWKQISKTN